MGMFQKYVYTSPPLLWRGRGGLEEIGVGRKHGV
jgi:hypothetical protein